MIRKMKFILKLMASQAGKQTIAIHILPNISRIKGNQEMKFDQLIEYNMKNPFLINQNWAYLWIDSMKPCTVCFGSMSSWGQSIYIEAKLHATFLYIMQRTSPPASFSAWFLKENLSLIIFYYMAKFHCLVAFTSCDIGQYVYCNCF